MFLLIICLVQAKKYLIPIRLEKIEMRKFSNIHVTYVYFLAKDKRAFIIINSVSIRVLPRQRSLPYCKCHSLHHAFTTC